MAFKLADDRICFGCGSRNARGLKLRFEVDEGQGRLFWMEAKAEDSTGRILATAAAKCVAAKRES